jgi:pSer/pThr/pTyr-binding forkhead associated (FHA) protein
MPRMIISLDGKVVRQVQFSRERTTFGRRPYNDIVVDNLSVSGEHALFHMVGQEVFVEDLGSTNGTYVNGKAIKKAQLESGDLVEIAKYKIRFLADGAPDNFEKIILGKPRPHLNEVVPPHSAPAAASTPGANPAPTPAAPSAPPLAPDFKGSIKVLSGSGAGREVALTKTVTTMGKPGVAVASITRRSTGYVLNHVEGAGKPKLNGLVVGTDPVPMKHGDELELAGTRMQFILS